jgi:hypothetical protein
VFDNPRYITKGFQNTIPIETQLILFYLLDSTKNAHKLDYLQVFDLTDKKLNHNRNLQKIILSQEQPKWSKTVYYPVKDIVTAKVFVIDDEDHHTFLLADEY